VSHGIITRVAGLGGRGYGKGGYSGDGGPATEAELRCPLDAAIDPSGNFFIADRANSVVRRVDRSGVISTFAGGGTVDLTTPSPPSEVPATEARFQPESPAQIEVDSAGMSSSRTSADTASGRSILPATSPHSPARDSQGSPAMVDRPTRRN
jgi:hypothetical protein